MAADILFTIKDSKAVVSGITPKGIEWILINCAVDTPTIEYKHMAVLIWQMECEGLTVEWFG